ncbi:squalene/phytoene synthase family protein [Streptomyces sp. NPDC029004]|uniref:phytoene/squalene synthase family protein n=1 Tax=Streptomyces sp. NPDC029004 TaxID=3154490 RepID=UPI0033F52224
MATWSRTLDQAGITDPLLRRDYSELRRLVTRFARAEYVAVRLLLPAPLVPHIIAATAFMHDSDNRIDQGPFEQRLAALADWERQVRAVLASDAADEPVLRALIHTITRHPQLRKNVESYLAGAPSEVQWEGFATEADFRHYVDTYSHPAFMLIACLLAPPPPADAYSAGCRTFIEASQRLDFLEDIAEDLQNGRLGIPEDALAQHGVTRNDLHRGEDCGRVSELMDQQLALIRPGLTASHRLVDLVEPQSRQLIRALVTLQEIRLRAVEKRGPALLRGPAEMPVAAAVRVLAREYRSARRQRDVPLSSPPRAGRR